MKKKMIALLAGALMTLSASSAFATFADFDLIRVVYNTSTGNETVTDLGNINTLLGQASSAGGSLKISDNLFTAGAGLGGSQDANLMVAYLAGNISGGSANNVWLSATSGMAQNINPAQYNGFQGSFFTVFGGLAGTYDPAGAAQQSIANWKTDSTSYTYSFNPSGNLGSFASYLTTSSTTNGEASLASLATASIQQGLYYWADGNISTNSQIATILTNADGSTTVQVASTPIPAAIYLMGSGLLGMFGLRRKQRG